MPLSETQYTPPYAEPIHLDEMKLHLRLESTFTADDTLVTSLIKTAREHCETKTQRQLIAATWKLYLDEFPCCYDAVRYAPTNAMYGEPIRLGHSPLMGVDSISYVDTNGATQTLATSVYSVDKNTEPARIVLAYNQVWPPTRPQMNAVTITYVAGFATPYTISSNDMVVSGGSYTVSQRVRLTNSGGALPTPFAVNTDYIVLVAGGLMRLGDNDSAPVLPTGAGSGTSFIGYVPESIRSAMKLLCGEMYENREASTASVSKPTMDAVERLLRPFCVMEMA
jgi:uncharacterized phiE125 gp8 family phage protein